MKKIALSVCLCLTVLLATAQPRPHQANNKPHTVPPKPASSLTLTSHHQDESFLVYVDGNLISKKVLRDITIPNLSIGPHDIYVVLKHPTDKITMMHYDARKPAEAFFVSYDPIHNSLKLIPRQVEQQVISQPQPQGAHICTFEEVEKMYQQIRKESFDDTRLSLAKSLVSHRNLGSHQIKRLTQAFDFDNTKVEFLKFAYASCIDPNNYTDCLEELSFDSDRKRVLEFLGF